jgi:hypothetical protein
VAASAAGIGASAPAQTIRGTVSDSATSLPLGARRVSLIDGRQAVVTRAVSDSAGRFLLQAPRPGTYTLRLERIEYDTEES